MSRGGVHSLESLRKAAAAAGEDSDGGGASSGDDGNEYYAGGASQRGGGGSGLSVLGPPGAGGPPHRGAADPFESIVDRGRREMQQPGGGLRPGEQAVEVVFYANGFTVDGGALREPGVPENDRFLADMAEGVCPAELVRGGRPATVKVADKRGETFKPPAYVAFSGGGQSMGAGAGAEGVVQPRAGAAKPAPPLAGEPTVRVQLVFDNRKREVVQLVKSATVRALIAHIDASGHVAGPYQMLLAAAGPPKPLTDFAANVVDAGLAGASVTVKAVTK
jgi:hypothetical protein